MDTGLAPSWIFSPEFHADPFPTYRRLREESPVCELEVMGVRLLLLTRHADVLAALRDPRLSSAAVPRELLPRQLADGNIFYKDPPDHTRVRALLAGAFTPHVAEARRARVQVLADELFDAVATRGRMDVLADLATPLSLTLVCEMIGLPATDHGQLKAWSDSLAVLLDGTRMLDGIGDAPASAVAFIAYLEEHIAQRRRAPRADLLTSLVTARHGADRLTDDELVATCLFTFIAGHETVTGLVGNGVLALLSDPAALERFSSAPLRLAASATEELLRFEGPAQLTIRLATTALDIGGHHVEPGQAVCCVLAAANRDPEVFTDPERLDLGRADNRHLAFGQGAHYCLGAPLARIESQVLFSTLMRRARGLRLVDSGVRRQPGLVLRALGSLQVEFEPAP